MSNEDRDAALRQIRQNIAEHGSHIYLVKQDKVPRFAYTIGLVEAVKAELVLAGAILFQGDEVLRVLQELSRRLRHGGASFEEGVELRPFGTFHFRRVDASWVRLLLLGALDYYDQDEIPACQVVPDHEHWTIDVPDLSRPWSASAEPVWRWLGDDWSYSVPPSSHVATNLEALRGARVTEVSRWEEDYWEAFAGSGSGLAPEDARVVPLGTLLGADDSLGRILDLKVGESIWRDPEGGDWNAWETSK